MVSENQSVRDALEYHRRGWAVIPIPRGTKSRKSSGWREYRYTEQQIENAFIDVNIGVMLGTVSDNLVDIDLDEPIASIIADELMPATLTFGRKGKPRSHRLYRTTDWSARTRKYSDPLTKSTLVEMRGDGALTVFPGSIHESGQIIDWSTENEVIEPAELTREALENYVHLVTSATIIAKYWPAGARHDATLSLAGWLIRNRMGADEIYSFIHAITSAAKDEEQRDRLAGVQTSLNRFEEGENISGYPTLVEKIDERILRMVAKWLGLSSRTVEELTATNTTDEGNADRFIRQFMEIVRYCEEQKTWYVWDNRVWRKDMARLRVERLAADTARTIYEEAAQAATQAERAELAAWATQSNNKTRLDAMVSRASSRPEIRASIHDFDSNPDLLCVQNGTYDLEREVLLQFDKEHMITKMANAMYDDTAPQCYLVRMVIGSIENKETIKSLQKGFGLGSSGRTDKVIFFCYGPTDTGKTTLLTQGLQAMLGDYAKQVSLEAIAGGRDRGKEIWIADIHGARYALASEPPRNFVLDTAAIKAMTGDSTQKARALYEMPYDSVPIATVFIDTNYRPDVPDSDDAIWNRIQLVHFKNKVKKVAGEPGYIPNFKDKIKEQKEMSGLLNWCIEGYKLWREEGFTASAQMIADKEEYRADQDNVKAFIDMYVQNDELGVIPLQTMWERFSIWEKGQGVAYENQQTKSSLTDVLTGKGWQQKIMKVNGKATRCWIGVQLSEGTDNMRQGSSPDETTFRPYSE
jgi:putative DNA primase/helicase